MISLIAICPRVLCKLGALFCGLVCVILHASRCGVANNSKDIGLVLVTVLLGVWFDVIYLHPLKMWDVLRELSVINAPRVLLQLVALLFMSNGAMPQNLDMTEYFAGEMAVPCPLQLDTLQGWLNCPCCFAGFVAAIHAI